MQTAPKIDIGIMTANVINLSFKGDFKIQGSDKIFVGDYSVGFENNEIVLKKDNVEIYKDSDFIIVPLNFYSSEFELKEVTIGVNFHWEQQENQKFQGSLKFIIVGDKISAINVLPLENYLISVISSEMSATSSLELLKAHAIISRSWLIAQIEKQDNLSEKEELYESIYETKDEFVRWYDREDHTNFHVCADDHCQRYQGTTRSHNPNVIKAVNETAGVIISYKGIVCDARFSKCCGGISELFENCWEPENHPYLTAVIDNSDLPEGFATNLILEKNSEEWIRKEPGAFCNTKNKAVLKQVLNEYDWTANDFYRWTKEYSQDQLSLLIFRRSGHDFGKIIDLVPVERGTSGRLIKLKIIGSKKSLTLGKELEIRRWFSESHLYSSAFVIEKQNVVEGIPQKFILYGAGWGHGVGLCQIGAAVMGYKGYKFDEILNHYFKNTTIEKQY